MLGLPAAGFSSGEALRLMDENAARTLPPGTAAEWTAMSYQEKVVGNQMYSVFAMALLLVYLVLAAQYESWYTPAIGDPLGATRGGSGFGVIGLAD